MKRSILLLPLLLHTLLNAQFLQAPPDGDNQHCRVSQSVSNVATVTVDYHSPDVDGRRGAIWGHLVPYGQVWRAGANENTTIEFSANATIGGHAVPAGKYGFFAIPGEREWTLILSKTNSAWGAFAYEESEDLLRFTAVPQKSEYSEYLSYEFTERKPSYTALTLKWEDLSVSFRIEFAAHELVIESFKAQLKGEIGLFNWEGCHQAAQYCLDHGIFPEQGLEWARQSVQVKPQFTNLLTRSKLEQALGDTEAAKNSYELAVKMATPNDLYYHGRALLGEEKTEEAMAIFQQNHARYGDLFLTQLGLARGYRAKQDYAAALQHFKAALQLAELPRQRTSMERFIAEMEAKLAEGDK